MTETAKGLETCNLLDGVLFPAEDWSSPPASKAGTYRVAYCLNNPVCSNVVLLTLDLETPDDLLVKMALDAGWYADAGGYALCPEHNFKNRQPKKPGMTGRQKQEAFVSIRDRNLRLANKLLKDDPANPEDAPCFVFFVDDLAAARRLRTLADTAPAGREKEAAALNRGAEALEERAIGQAREHWSTHQ